MLHPLEKIAKKHFGVTDNLEETGYVLSDGTFLDLSGRHQAGGYIRKGDRFVPERGRPDYLQGDRVIDHRQLPSEILDAVGTREGSASMFAFLHETGALRFMPGAGFLVERMPTIESLARVVREWHHAFGNEPLFVDVINPDGDVRESQEFERPQLDEIVEFLESKFGGVSMGAPARSPIESGVKIRPTRRLDPADIEIFLTENGVQVGRAHVIYGPPKKLVDKLNSIYAYGMAEWVQQETRSPVGILEYIEVGPRHRGQGLGQRLMREAVEALREKGVRVVYLQASADVGGIPESVLIKLYQGFGFVLVGRTGDHADDPVMVLER